MLVSPDCGERYDSNQRQRDHQALALWATFPCWKIRMALPKGAHRQPAVGALLDVLALLQPELVDVEVKSLVLVEDHDGGDVEFGDHRSFSPLRELMGTTLMLRGRRCGGVSHTARSPHHPRPRGRH